MPDYALPGQQYNSFAPTDSGDGLEYGGGSMPSYSDPYGGGDPFAYTNGTLLTPWTKPFNYQGPAAGSGGFSMDPFHYADLNYGFSAPGSFDKQLQFGPYADPTAYRPDQVGAPISYQGQPVARPDQFRYSGIPVPGEYQGPAPGGPASFGYTPMATPDRFAGPGAFVAPDINESNDPGLKFRRDQGLDAIQNRLSAQGIRGGDAARAMSEYSQNYASSEYDKVYGRAFGAFNQDYANRANAYSLDTGTQLAANAQQYGQASNAFGMNQQAQQAYEQQRMAAYQANLQRQNQGYQQEFGAADLNSRNQIATDQFNAQQSYNAWQAEQQMRQSAQQANQGANLSAAQMNEANRLNAYNANYQTQAGMFDRSLAAFGQNSQNQLAAGRLGWDVASGSWDRNYAKDFANYQMQYQMGAANAAGGASASNQEYNRALQQYQMEYDIFNQNQNNQFNRLTTMAGIGQNSANAMGAYGSNYAGNMANLYGAGANASAAGTMGRANAWGGAVGGIGSTVGTGILAASPLAGFYGPQRQSGSRTPSFTGDAGPTPTGWYS